MNERIGTAWIEVNLTDKTEEQLKKIQERARVAATNIENTLSREIRLVGAKGIERDLIKIQHETAKMESKALQAFDSQSRAAIAAGASIQELNAMYGQLARTLSDINTVGRARTLETITKAQSAAHDDMLKEMSNADREYYKSLSNKEKENFLWYRQQGQEKLKLHKAQEQERLANIANTAKVEKQEYERTIKETENVRNMALRQEAMNRIRMENETNNKIKKNMVDQAKYQRQVYLDSFKKMEQGPTNLERAIGRLTRTVIAFIGVWAFTEIVSGIKRIAGAAIDLNAKIEQVTIAVSAILGAQVNFSTAMSGSLDNVLALNAGMVEADRIIQQLRLDNLKTIATFDQLARAFQETLAPALAVGFNIQQVREFTLAAVQAAGAIGLSLDMMAEETRSLLTGTINPRTSRIAVALGITNEDIRSHKQNANDLFAFLMGKLKSFQVAGDAVQKSFYGLWSNLKDAVILALGKAGEPFFNYLKKRMQELFDFIVDIDEKTGEIELNPSFVAGAREFFHTVQSIVTVLRVMGELLGTFAMAWGQFVSDLDTGLNKVKKTLEEIKRLKSTEVTERITAGPTEEEKRLEAEKNRREELQTVIKMYDEWTKKLAELEEFGRASSDPLQKAYAALAIQMLDLREKIEGAERAGKRLGYVFHEEVADGMFEAAKGGQKMVWVSAKLTEETQKLSDEALKLVENLDKANKSFDEFSRELSDKIELQGLTGIDKDLKELDIKMRKELENLKERQKEVAKAITEAYQTEDPVLAKERQKTLDKMLELRKKYEEEEKRLIEYYKNEKLKTSKEYYEKEFEDLSEAQDKLNEKFESFYKSVSEIERGVGFESSTRGLDDLQREIKDIEKDAEDSINKLKEYASEIEKTIIDFAQKWGGKTEMGFLPMPSNEWIEQQLNLLTEYLGTIYVAIQKNKDAAIEMAKAFAQWEQASKVKELELDLIKLVGTKKQQLIVENQLLQIQLQMNLNDPNYSEQEKELLKLIAAEKTRINNLKAFGTVFDGVQEGFRNMAKEMETSFELGEKLARDMWQEFDSFFTKIFSGTEDVIDSFKDMGKQILALIKTTAAKALLYPIIIPIVQQVSSIGGGMMGLGGMPMMGGMGGNILGTATGIAGQFGMGTSGGLLSSIRLPGMDWMSSKFGGVTGWLNTPMWGGTQSVGFWPGMPPSAASGMGSTIPTWGQGIGAVAGGGLSIYSGINSIMQGGGWGNYLSGSTGILGGGMMLASLIPGLQFLAPIGGAISLIGSLFGGFGQGTPNVKFDFGKLRDPDVYSAYSRKYLVGVDPDSMDDADETKIGKDYLGAFTKAIDYMEKTLNIDIIRIMRENPRNIEIGEEAINREAIDVWAGRLYGGFIAEMALWDQTKESGLSTRSARFIGKESTLEQLKQEGETLADTLTRVLASLQNIPNAVLMIRERMGAGQGRGEAIESVMAFSEIWNAIESTLNQFSAPAYALSLTSINERYDTMRDTLEDLGYEVEKTNLELARMTEISATLKEAAGQISDAWKQIRQSIKDQIFNIETSTMNQQNPLERMNRVTKEIERVTKGRTGKELSDWLGGMSSEKAIPIVQRLQALYQQRLEMAGDVYQKPTAAYQKIYEETMNSLNRLLDLSKDRDTVQEVLRGEIKNQLVGIKDQLKWTRPQWKAVKSILNDTYHPVKRLSEYIVDKKLARDWRDAMDKGGGGGSGFGDWKDIWNDFIGGGKWGDLINQVKAGDKNIVDAINQNTQNDSQNTQQTIDNWKNYFRDLEGNAKGIDYVPSTGMYKLHRGERVLRYGEDENDGGFTANITINTASGDPREIAREVEKSMDLWWERKGRKKSQESNRFQ